MRPILAQFIRLSAGYSLVTLVGPLLTVLLTPLYTRVLAPADYASIDVMSTLTAILVGIGTLAMDHVLNSRYFDPSISSRSSLLRTAFVVVAVSAVGLSCIVAIFAPHISATLLQNPNLVLLPLIVSVSVFAGPLYVLIGAILRLQMNVRRVNLFGWCAVLVTAVGNLLLVVVLRLGVAGALIANAAAYVTCAILGTLMLWKDLRGDFNVDLARKLALAGVALLPGTLSWLLLLNIDRLLLTQYVSLEELGLYSLANKLASVLGFIFTTMWAAWLPMAISIIENKQDIRSISRMFEIFGGISIILALGVGLFSAEIFAIFTRSMYVPAAPYATALMMYTGPIIFMGSFFTIEHYAAKTTHVLGICTLIGALVNVVLNLTLNPLIGVWGAVLATLVGGAIVYTLAGLMRRTFGGVIKFSLKRMLVPIIFYLVVVSATLLGSEHLSFIVKVALLLVSLVIVFISLGMRLDKIGGVVTATLHK